MRLIFRLILPVVTLVSIQATVVAASPTKSPKGASPAKEVELFAGMESGEIDATMIMSDASKGVVNIKNKTDQPLTVKLPAALAGVPILAQRRGGGGMGGMGGAGGRNGGMGGMGGMQGMMGGGMMGGGMMGGGMGGMGMGGMMNIAPDKVQKVRIAAVCADHGLTDPSPRVPYKPVPIESYAKDPTVIPIVLLMCAGEIDQQVAQAAVWHLQNGLSWDELARKIGIKHVNGITEPYFTEDQVTRAIAASLIAQKLAARSMQKEEPSLHESLVK
jgi:hypothetical protein